MKLGLLCEKAQKVKKKDQVPSSSFLYLDIGGIDNSTNKIVGHKNFFWKDAPSRAQQIVQQGDVLFSTVRTYLKNIAQVKNPIYNGQICSSGFTVIRGKHSILNPDFIFFYSTSDIFIQPLNELQTGSSYPAVRDKDVFAQTIPLPPLPEQRAIVAKLEQLFSELEDGVANLQKAQQQLKVYRQAVLKKAFEGELTREWRTRQTDLPTAEELLEQIQAERERYYEEQLTEWKQAVADWEAEGKVGKKPRKPGKIVSYEQVTDDDLKYLQDLSDRWVWARVGELVPKVTVGYVGAMKNEYSPEGIPFLRGQNVRENRFSEKGLLFVSKKFHHKILKSALGPGDVVVVRSGNVGTACVVPNSIKEANCSDLVIAKRGSLVLPKLLSYFFNSITKTYVQSKKVGVALTHFNTKSVETTPFPFSSLPEQHQIVQEIESRLSVCDQLEQDIEANLKRAERLRQSLLQKAFAGELLTEAELEACRAEPDWEPAEKLLERIKGETK